MSDNGNTVKVEEIINPYKQFNGAWIPEWLLERKEISAHAKLIYAELCKTAGKDGSCFPSQRHICKKTGMSLRKAQYAIRELSDYGLIKSVRRGLQRSNAYFFLNHPWMQYRVGIEAHDNAHQETHDNACP